ncbi:Aminotransferase class IV [Macrophomina phaseolina MS6]|uniref:Aminotransferase class IV n=1 Tax=Macrophomina phaseolina (strain MS6) TaxID=1126212 RepID=K2S5V7_MACPH|nr:Aminotransferase class IV [Macrophomina phaseolina MS6]
MLEAAQHFEWTEVAKKLADGKALETILNQEVEKWRDEHNEKEAPLKIRILFNREGVMQTDITTTPPIPLSSLYPTSFTPTPPQKPKSFTPSPKTGGALILGPGDAAVAAPKAPSWILTIDTAATPTSPHTLLKTTHRAHYDAAKRRSVPREAPSSGQMHEVLLWNSVEEMTEGSFTSAYFYRGGRWVTPPVGVPNNVSEGEKAEGEAEGKENGEEGMAEQVPPGVSDEGELREPFAASECIYPII